MPDNTIQLDEGTHLWRINLETTTKQTALLSAEESARFARYRFARDRERHATARSSLRQILSYYLNVPPATLAIAYAANGKPFLPDYPTLHFNLSHAGGWALIGISKQQAIGVDVEPVDRSFAVADLVRRFFSTTEIPQILTQPAHAQHAAFYLAWTRKEAIIKAHGDGLRLPLSSFGVTIGLEEEVRLLHMDWAPQQCDEWQLASFMVAPEVPAAVAMHGKLGQIDFWDFT